MHWSERSQLRVRRPLRPPKGETQHLQPGLRPEPWAVPRSAADMRRILLTAGIPLTVTTVATTLARDMDAPTEVTIATITITDNRPALDLPGL